MAFVKTGTPAAKLVTLKTEPDKFYIKGNVTEDSKVELLDPDSLELIKTVPLSDLNDKVH